MIHLPLISMIFVLLVSFLVPAAILAPGFYFPADLSDFLYLAGKYFALAAFMILTFQYLWTAKFRFLERIRSYDRRVAVHRTLGVLGVLAVGLHPIFILVFYATQGVPVRIDAPMAMGFFSLLILLFIVGSTFLARLLNMRYESWKRLHWFTFPVLTLAFIHSVLLGSDVYGAVRVLWFTLWGFHLLVVVGKIIHKVRAWIPTYRITSIITETQNTRSIRIEKPRGTYLPGQFGFISAKLKGKWESWHPFSLTSHPDEESVSMTIKALGDFTQGIGELKEGDRIKTDLGFGAFSPRIATDSRYILIAAGVGITPVYGILKELDKSDPIPDVVLVYGVHHESDILFRNDLERWFEKHSNWALHITCTSQPDWPGETGRINADMIERLIESDYNGSFFLCGPSMMIKNVTGFLRSVGVPRRKIRREQFVFLP